uniref:formin-like protein 1 isoform X2 n=1 Tax=Ictidomys tridecemlineatus TaxID=43179 RepID=UPI001A9E70A8|nr:formin-like protein 1 isoform X2 [Ictidomys tridecemlineatus]
MEEARRHLHRDALLFTDSQKRDSERRPGPEVEIISPFCVRGHQDRGQARTGTSTLMTLAPVPASGCPCPEHGPECVPKGPLSSQPPAASPSGCTLCSGPPGAASFSLALPTWPLPPLPLSSPALAPPPQPGQPGQTFRGLSLHPCRPGHLPPYLVLCHPHQPPGLPAVPGALPLPARTVQAGTPSGLRPRQHGWPEDCEPAGTSAKQPRLLVLRVGPTHVPGCLGTSPLERLEQTDWQDVLRGETDAQALLPCSWIPLAAQLTRQAAASRAFRSIFLFRAPVWHVWRLRGPLPATFCRQTGEKVCLATRSPGAGQALAISCLLLCPPLRSSFVETPPQSLRVSAASSGRRGSRGLAPHKDGVGLSQ